MQTFVYTFLFHQKRDCWRTGSGESRVTAVDALDASELGLLFEEPMAVGIMLVIVDQANKRL